ncbi:MAG TPA: hypothetical protein ENO29_09570 [Candidatus Aminicenantes bacterium]|nr:MAG: hypothetical protein C0168_00340 [Candidatus Aminicenantes bacterium]HEK86584.1 hypothetical protein [Candidatus Aminicenantes bacterium]
MGKWWSFILQYISPLLFLAMTGWWFYQAIGWDKKAWWHPFKVNSMGTIFSQWVLLFLAVVLLNKRLARWIKNPVIEDEE